MLCSVVEKWRLEIVGTGRTGRTGNGGVVVRISL